MWKDGVVGHFEIQRRVIAPNLTLAASETRADEKSDLPVYRLGPNEDFDFEKFKLHCATNSPELLYPKPTFPKR
jgi:hypothetical protein